MTVDYEFILVERDPPIATVRLNRPKVLNALSRELVAELVDAFASLDDDDQVRARHGVLSLDNGLPVVANPVRVGTTDGAVASRATTDPPALGQHSTEVLGAAGYDDDAIAALRAGGVT